MSIQSSYRVLGHILHHLPDDRPIHSWEIADDYVGGQVLSDIGLSAVRSALSDLAVRIGQMSDVTESAHTSYVWMETNGRVGDVRVKLWAICRPRPESES